MDIKIDLEDVEELEGVFLSNAEEQDKFFITLVNDGIEMYAKLSMDEVRRALRKLALK